MRGVFAAAVFSLFLWFCIGLLLAWAAAHFLT